MDAAACNYDATALIGNTALCQYPASSLVNCAGDCIVAVDCEGVCGGPTAEDACGVCGGDNSTCTDVDEAACNTDSTAVTDDPSLCEYPLLPTWIATGSALWQRTALVVVEEQQNWMLAVSAVETTAPVQGVRM